MKQAVAELAASIKDLQVAIVKSVPPTLRCWVLSFLEWLSQTIDEISATLVRWWYRR